MATKRPKVWKAEPHTIAKNVILYEYLVRWFLILGRTKRNQSLVYIDGFAGPGEYVNFPKGSPVQAIEAATTALSDEKNWVAGKIECYFIEADKDRFGHLKQKISSLSYHKNISVQLLNDTFESGVSAIMQHSPTTIIGNHPLFVFKYLF